MYGFLLLVVSLLAISLLSGETFYDAEANTPVISIGQEKNIASSKG